MSIGAVTEAELATIRDFVDAERRRDNYSPLADVAVQLFMVIAARDEEIARLRARSGQLELALRDAVYSFHEKAHPGRPALKAMVDEARVKRWHALAYNLKDEDGQ